MVEQIARDLRASFPGTQGLLGAQRVGHAPVLRRIRAPEVLRQLAAEGGEPALRRPGRSTAVASAATRDTEVLRQLVAEVPWGHHLLILSKLDAPAQRIFYLRACAAFGWSRNVLLNQIKADAHGRSQSAGKSHNFPLALPANLAEQAEEALKSSYNLEFLGIRQAVKERELENQLIEKLRDFILELGYGFCFIGRQHRLTLGRNEYFIDLLFYHRFLKSLVAVELKIGKFEPEYAGKMDFYLNLLNEKERAPDDAPSIGIILCAEKDNLEVEFALKSKSNPIGVAEYQLQDKLPAEMKGKLPTARQLQGIVRLPTRTNASP
ncbi:PDDEXK nuclease domain-containing protein [Variovorax sp. EBFNA2]|uniref:PDDEXK nuclease domain-containing protein n=1 Tax=Variovorax sp. EBFNA2 TaxID=3342097 RepID=UPI0029C07553|nr:PDDEXK nuclease domain-containing protein [Variovorax boronicumulans]WPG41292.1 PDDEXK nuclease domain-containing protein [Variovorax boronicumulans]